ncbi:hypothetical protein CASFOL_042817 [Castilleja foliolosa]|uniref:Uncharacterized protein n=1 Tax=Castilleja foliolosa TaxID=1961234 RepID=A0ABD3B7F7_9LAMI
MCRCGKTGHRGLKRKIDFGQAHGNILWEPPKQWTIGIHKVDSHKEIKLFKAKYCAAILCDEVNNKGKSNLSKAAKILQDEEGEGSRTRGGRRPVK